MVLNNAKKWLLTICLSILLGAFWTVVFYPGLPNHDALYQWGQATEDFYTDIAPLGTTLIMKAIIILFPNLLVHQQIAILCLMQGTIFWLTLFYSIETFILNQRVKYISRLAIPFYYPLWTFSVSPIKDVWLAIWFLLLVCEIYKLLVSEQEHKVSKVWYLKSIPYLGLLFIYINLAILTRHNITLSLILFVIYLYLLSKYLFKLSFKKRIVQYFLLFFIIVSVFISNIIGDFFYTERLSTKERMNFYFSLELIGSIFFTNQNIEELKFLETPSQLGIEKVSKAVQTYRCGKIDQYLYSRQNPPLKNMQYEVMKVSIMKDLFNISIKYPQALLKYKLCSVSSLLQIHQLFEPFQSTIPENKWSRKYQIKSKNYTPTIRGRVVKFLTLVNSRRELFLLNLPYRHYLLFLTSMIISFYMIGKYRLNSWKNSASLFLFGAALCNLLPYMVVTPDFSWRYLLFSNIVWLFSILTFWNPLLNDRQENTLTPKDKQGKLI